MTTFSDKATNTRAFYLYFSDIWGSIGQLFQTYNEFRIQCDILDRQMNKVQKKMDQMHREQRETEQARQRSTRSVLDKIPEVEEPQQPEIAQPEIPSITVQDVDMRRVTEGPTDILNATNVPNITALEVPNITDAMNVPEVPNVLEQQDLNIQVPMDIADLPTQKLETLSQARKRTSENESPPKRMRSVGYKSFRESQQQQKELVQPDVLNEPDKENIPPDTQQSQSRRQADAHVSSMLQQAGLADIQPGHISQPGNVVVEVHQESQPRPRKDGSESSETPLGSLDRTKVSLGDSVKTTDSQRFIRNEWGIEGTMIKIMRAVKAEGTVTINRLLKAGPVMPGHRRIIAARCFTSILKLKQHGFVRIVKDPKTLEILDMTLGPRFDNM